MKITCTVSIKTKIYAAYIHLYAVWSKGLSFPTWTVQMQEYITNWEISTHLLTSNLEFAKSKFFVVTDFDWDVGITAVSFLEVSLKN